MILSLPDAASLNTFIQNFGDSSQWGNFIVSVLCALFMFTMRTETATKERPWTTYLGLAFSVFAIQYLTIILFLYIREAPPPYLLKQMYGTLISFFLLLAAQTFANKSKLLSNFIIVIIVLEIIRSFYYYYFPAPQNIIGIQHTAIRISSYLLTIIAFWYFGYSVFLNTKIYKSKIGFIVGFIYGAIHFIAPLIPDIVQFLTVNIDSGLINGCKELQSFIDSKPQVGLSELECYQRLLRSEILTLLICISIPLKLFLFYFAFRITNLETRSLIKIRKHLRGSVNSRQEFFSSEVLLKAIKQVFKVDAVDLEVLVPSEKENVAHVFSYLPESEKDSGKTEPYKIKILNEPLYKKFENLQLQESKSRIEQIKGNKILRKLRIFFTGIIEKREIPPFDGVVPIKYHGGLIGSLTLKKSDARDFTYSAQRLCYILSEDISTLVQFHRLQIASGFLIDELIKISPRPFSFQEINENFTNIIHKTLSPLKTSFTIDAGFVKTTFEKNEKDFQSVEVDKEVEYECKTNEVNDGRTFGTIKLNYNKSKDLFKKPSMGSYKPYREMVGKITTKFYLSLIEQKLNRIIEELSVELTKRHTYDGWFDVLTKSIQQAEHLGIAVFHPDKHTFWQSKASKKLNTNQNLISILENAYPHPKDIFKKFNDLNPTAVLTTPEILVVGIKLPLKSLAETRPKEFEPSDRESAIFIGIKRLEFADELDENSPWKTFLVKLSEIADNSLSRILFAKNIQQDQTENLEKRSILNISYLINFITHDLMNSLSRLSGGTGMINSHLSTLKLGTPLDAEIIEKLQNIQDAFKELQATVSEIRDKSKLQTNVGPNYLFKAINKARVIVKRKLKSDIDIHIVHKNHAGESSELAEDIEVTVDSDLVSYLFISLIENSIQAINDKEKSNEQGKIKIWAKIVEGNKFVDIYVQDNGTGVLPDIKDDIFNIGISRKTSGGWGLTLTLHMLRTNGGSIELYCSEPGKTIFLVRIPIHDKNN